MVDETRSSADVLPEPRRPAAERRGGAVGPQDQIEAGVRDDDLEPHEGLRYIARLFKVLAVLLVLMLLFEVIIGLVQQGDESIPTLVVEATRLVVFAALLWGAGDLALMLIESNHDLRATRILVGRLNTKVQRMVDIETDELELMAANPSHKSSAGESGAPPLAR
jgi:hypothetical protein